MDAFQAAHELKAPISHQQQHREHDASSWEDEEEEEEEVNDALWKNHFRHNKSRS